MSGQIHFLKTDGADLISYRLESKNLCLLIFTNSDIIRGHSQKRIHWFAGLNLLDLIALFERVTWA